MDCTVQVTRRIILARALVTCFPRLEKTLQSNLPPCLQDEWFFDYLESVHYGLPWFCCLPGLPGRKTSTAALLVKEDALKSEWPTSRWSQDCTLAANQKQWPLSGSAPNDPLSLLFTGNRVKVAYLHLPLLRTILSLTTFHHFLASTHTAFALFNFFLLTVASSQSNKIYFYFCCLYDDDKDLVN